VTLATARGEGDAVAPAVVGTPIWVISKARVCAECVEAAESVSVAGEPQEDNTQAKVPAITSGRMARPARKIDRFSRCEPDVGLPRTDTFLSEVIFIIIGGIIPFEGQHRNRPDAARVERKKSAAGRGRRRRGVG
jgi:hypothetical protein